jgi:hypothetical protein
MTRFLVPQPSRETVRPPAPGRPPPSADDVRVLTDRVVGDGVHDACWRATAATRLAAAFNDDDTLLTPGITRALDERLPGLLLAATATGPDAGPLSALCAALANHLSEAVCPPLQSLVRHAPTEVAVAAHIASLLVEGLTPSAQHLSDLMNLVEVDVRLLHTTRGKPLPTRAAVLAYALAVAPRTTGRRPKTPVNGASEEQHRPGRRCPWR